MAVAANHFGLFGGNGGEVPVGLAPLVVRLTVPRTTPKAIGKLVVLATSRRS